MAPVAAIALFAASQPARARHGELPNRIPEPPPYNVEEAKAFPPPYDQHFAEQGGPQVCAGCHAEIFDQWNGSMMANAWRDPAWRGAFFLIARLTATDGNCDIPDPPDGTPKSKINPFDNGNCTSTFDLGTAKHTTNGSGSLLDGFCSRCHMPSNYIDAVQPKNIETDPETGAVHGLIDPDFDPTSARDTKWAFATVDEKNRNTEPGKLGITCTFCHTITSTRRTPFHNFEPSGTPYTPATETSTRAEALPPELQEIFTPKDPSSQNLGYAVGAGAYAVSPQAIVQSERFGPLSTHDAPEASDPYVSGVFKTDIAYQKSDFKDSIHKGNYHVLFERAEMCATCHDVTNPLTIKNAKGKWVGGFPIERTYSEWASSRYADRPDNKNFDPRFKRDCQTCHMQQHFGAAGTAQALYKDGAPLPPLTGVVAKNGPERPIFHSHHFVGGNTYSTQMLGANSSVQGKANPYPELSIYSYSSSDPESKYYNAYFENTENAGPPTHHVRMAWDRLRNALEIDLDVPKEVVAGTDAKIAVTVANTGTGHNFPTGFPEGRNAWIAVRAFDVHSGSELMIKDSFWKRESLGVGYLIDKDVKKDPNFPGCDWKLPAGSPDPYAWQFRAVASLGDGCPTLELPYATPLNLVVNEQGLPIDAEGRIIGRSNPTAKPQFRDLDKDGDKYDDSFLLDNRLRPMPHDNAQVTLDRYSVVVPQGVQGPISITTAVYYQSMEAVVAKKLLGNLADKDLDHVLEPCVLRGPCDGRVPTTEPAVVEGAAPVPIRLSTQIANIAGVQDTTPPAVSVYPAEYETNAHLDAVIKITGSEPIRGVSEETFHLMDQSGTIIPAKVAQIDDYTWALFPDQVFLEPASTYYAELVGPVCDFNDNCDPESVRWSFLTASQDEATTADTRPPPPPTRPALPTPIADVGQSLSPEPAWWIALTLALAVLAFFIGVWVYARHQIFGGPETAEGAKSGAE